MRTVETVTVALRANLTPQAIRARAKKLRLVPYDKIGVSLLWTPQQAKQLCNRPKSGRPKTKGKAI